MLLALGYARNTTHRGDLACGVGAIYELVVEGVSGASALARPEEGLVGVCEGRVQGVWDRVGLSPGYLAHHPFSIQTLAR